MDRGPPLVGTALVAIALTFSLNNVAADDMLTDMRTLQNLAESPLPRTPACVTDESGAGCSPCVKLLNEWIPTDLVVSQNDHWDCTNNNNWPGAKAQDNCFAYQKQSLTLDRDASFATYTATCAKWMHDHKKDLGMPDYGDDYKCNPDAVAGTFNTIEVTPPDNAFLGTTKAYMTSDIPTAWCQISGSYNKVLSEPSNLDPQTAEVIKPDPSKNCQTSEDVYVASPQQFKLYNDTEFYQSMGWMGATSGDAFLTNRARRVYTVKTGANPWMVSSTGACKPAGGGKQTCYMVDKPKRDNHKDGQCVREFVLDNPRSAFKVAIEIQQDGTTHNILKNIIDRSAQANDFTVLTDKKMMMYTFADVIRQSLAEKYGFASIGVDYVDESVWDMLIEAYALDIQTPKRDLSTNIKNWAADTREYAEPWSSDSSTAKIMFFGLTVSAEDEAELKAAMKAAGADMLSSSGDVLKINADLETGAMVECRNAVFGYDSTSVNPADGTLTIVTTAATTTPAPPATTSGETTTPAPHNEESNTVFCKTNVIAACGRVLGTAQSWQALCDDMNSTRNDAGYTGDNAETDNTQNNDVPHKSWSSRVVANTKAFPASEDTGNTARGCGSYSNFAGAYADINPADGFNTLSNRKINSNFLQYPIHERQTLLFKNNLFTDNVDELNPGQEPLLGVSMGPFNLAQVISRRCGCGQIYKDCADAAIAYDLIHTISNTAGKPGEIIEGILHEFADNTTKYAVRGAAVGNDFKTGRTTEECLHYSTWPAVFIFLATLALFAYFKDYSSGGA